MRVLITGAAGFVGQTLAKELLNHESNEVILTDKIDPTIPSNVKFPGNARIIQADLLTASATVVSEGLDAAVLLHGIMSGGAEANFELGYRVNVDATRALLDSLISVCPGVRVVYASSQAVYGRPLPERSVTERDMPTPELSYGSQKMICESFINDYTRKGKINGFSLRFPTISVRPGTPAPALTAFLSGIIREPLNGEVCVVPMKDRNWRHWMCSPKTLIYNINVALKLPKDCLPSHLRMINVPGFAVTIQDMLDALEAVGGKEALAFVREEEQPELSSRLQGWADDFDNTLGLSLGMKQDSAFIQLAKDYMEEVQRPSQANS